MKLRAPIYLALSALTVSSSVSAFSVSSPHSNRRLAVSGRTFARSRATPLFAILKRGQQQEANEEENKINNDATGGRSSRRDLLRSAVAASVVGSGSSGALNSDVGASAAAAAEPPSSSLLADVPMIRLKLPKNGLGKDFVAIQLCLDGQGKPVEFMLDTGLTLELVTPHLQKELKLSSQSSTLTDLTAGGASTGANAIVDLRNAAICNNDATPLVRLPELHAVVTDFPQEHIDPKHDPVEGMLGLEMLSQFDVDLDFPKGRVRLYKPGTAASNAAQPAGLVEIPAVVINDTGILGIRVTTAKQGQPVLGIIDCGSSFSAVNWKAAAFLGLPDKNDRGYTKGPSVVAVGVDGRPIQLPTTKQSLSFSGDAQQDDQGKLTGFQAPPSSWKAWDPISLAVGDLPVFPELLGDGVRKYDGPAALIGLDILAQRRVIIESAGQTTTRRRRLFVSPR